MNLLLFRKTVIVSSLTESELIRRLSEIVDFKKTTSILNFSDGTKYYTGKIQGRKFKIHKTIKGINSFIPIIQGNIIENFTTRSIELKLRLHFIVILFLLWISALVTYYLIKLNDYNALLFIGLLLGMTIFLFNQECNKSIRDLEEVLLINPKDK